MPRSLFHVGSVALSPDGRRLYVGDEEAKLVAVVDLVARRRLKSFRTTAPTRGLSLTPDASMLYVPPARPRPRGRLRHRDRQGPREDPSPRSAADGRSLHRTRADRRARIAGLGELEREPRPDP